MRAGDLDRQISLLTRTVVRDEYGGEEETWAASPVWAKREDVGAMESIRAGQVAATVESRFTIRDPVTPIDATMRVQDGVEVFDVAKITRLSQRRREGFELLCRSRDRAGTQDY